VDGARTFLIEVGFKVHSDLKPDIVAAVCPGGAIHKTKGGKSHRNLKLSLYLQDENTQNE
jgi:hypothetical protein